MVTLNPKELSEAGDIILLSLSLPFVKSGTGASLGRSISVDPASPRLQVILLV